MCISGQRHTKKHCNPTTKSHQPHKLRQQVQNTQNKSYVSQVSSLRRLRGPRFDGDSRLRFTTRHRLLACVVVHLHTKGLQMLRNNNNKETIDNRKRQAYSVGYGTTHEHPPFALKRLTVRCRRPRPSQWRGSAHAQSHNEQHPFTNKCPNNERDRETTAEREGRERAITGSGWSNSLISSGCGGFVGSAHNKKFTRCTTQTTQQ